MAITILASQSGNGPRMVDPNKDFPQLIQLLRLVFGKELDAEGQKFLRTIPDSRTPAFFWRLDPLFARLTPGFVWVEGKNIVGNVTLLPTRLSNRYLVANVAVHPDYRRRGIARMLMAEVHREVRKRDGAEILLQVDHDNESALGLYRSLGYDVRGNMIIWRSSVSRVRDLPNYSWRSGDQVNPRKLENGRWKEAYQIDKLALDPDLNWPEPLQADTFKRGFWQRATDFLNGRFRHSWMTLGPDHRMNGHGVIIGEWGRPHQLSLRVHPSWRGHVEWVLLQKMIDEIRSLPRRNIQMIHLATDDEVNRLLVSANFSQHRELTHMRLTL